MTPEEKFNLLQEYPGFVFIQDLTSISVTYHSYLTFPDGSESAHCYDDDRDAVISHVFKRYYAVVTNTCDIIERTKPR